MTGTDTALPTVTGEPMVPVPYRVTGRVVETHDSVTLELVPAGPPLPLFDLRGVIEANPGLDDAALTALCERAIRNHDPCISCSAHFLTLSVTRG